MKIFWLRLFLTFLVQFILYQKTVSFLVLAIFIFTLGCFLSHPKFYFKIRDRWLSLLVDKIFFSSTLIVLADLKILSVILAAWIIGAVFIHSGIDLLQRSLQKGSLNLNVSWFENLTHMGFVLTVMIIFSLESKMGSKICDLAKEWVSYAWVFFTIFLLLRALLSEKFRKLIKEA